MANIEDFKATEKIENKPKVARLSGNISPELAEFLNEHRFDVRKDKGEFLEYALTEYAKSVGYSPKV